MRSLRTQRLTLEPLQVEDAVEMVAVLADPGLYTFTGGEPPMLPELEARYRAWVAGPPRGAETWHNWIVRLADGGDAIGHLQATIVNNGVQADIAWLIGTRWQGHGHAAEAAVALVAWLEAAGVETITAHVHPGHAASGRVATKAGLAPTDRIEDGEIVWARSRARG